MKKLILLISMCIYCFAQTTIAQTLTTNATTINSGGTVTVKGSGENNSVYYIAEQGDYINSVTPYNTNASIYFSSAVYYNSSTNAPTTFQYIFTNTSTVVLTINFCVRVLPYDNVNLKTLPQQTFCFTIKVNPAASTYYNSATSANFIRNNCGTGSTGSTVTYNVPANQYNSNVSQADADSKATADLNANGQNYANTNGTCTVNKACYNYTLSANQGFSTTYQWTDCGGVVRSQHIEPGYSNTVCAQDGSVTGGPYTKGAACH